MSLMKDDIFINPKTQRPIRVGGVVWQRLVRDGVIEDQYNDRKDLHDIEEGEDVDEVIQELNETLPANKQAVRGRGKYANKIVQRNKAPSSKDIVKLASKAAAKALKKKAPQKEKKEKFVVHKPEEEEPEQEPEQEEPEDEEDDDIERKMEKLILEEMFGRPKTISRQKKENYHTEEPEEVYEFETSSDDEE